MLCSGSTGAYYTCYKFAIVENENRVELENVVISVETVKETIEILKSLFGNG